MHSPPQWLTSESLRLYLLILSHQGKHEQVLKLLTDDALGTLTSDGTVLCPIPAQRRALQAEAARALSMHVLRNTIAQEMLADDPDAWDGYIMYFDSLEAIIIDK
jgi:hypothetical protein